MNDSIIVYHTPMEKALWEGDYAGVLVPVILAVTAFFVVFFLIDRIIPQKLKKCQDNSS